MFSVAKFAVILLFVTVVYSASLQKREVTDDETPVRGYNKEIQKKIKELEGNCENDETPVRGPNKEIQKKIRELEGKCENQTVIYVSPPEEGHDGQNPPKTEVFNVTTGPVVTVPVEGNLLIL